MSAMSDASEQVAACETRIGAAAADIAKVVTSDLGKYPDRELQRRFIANPERAGKITDTDLKRLREESRAVASELASEVATLLADESLWLKMVAGDDEIPHGKELSLIAPVWDALRVIDTRFEKLADRYHLPDERDPPGYKPPRMFVDRLYLPTLIEKCLRELSNLRNFRKAASAENHAVERQSLSSRWNAAAPDGDI